MNMEVGRIDPNELINYLRLVRRDAEMYERRLTLFYLLLAALVTLTLIFVQGLYHFLQLGEMSVYSTLQYLMVFLTLFSSLLLLSLRLRRRIKTEKEFQSIRLSQLADIIHAIRVERDFLSSADRAKSVILKLALLEAEFELDR